MTAAGPRGRQCRRPAPSAPCSRAQAPRAGGLGAAFRFGWGGGGSRRRQAHEQGPAACGAFGDAALPRWARGAAGMRGRRCLPCGQRRCRVARWIMACRGRERGFRSGLPIRELYQRAGERGNGPHPAGDGDTRHLADRTRLLPAKPSTSSYRRKRGALQGTSHARRGKPPRRAPKTGVPRLFTTHPRLFTAHPVPFTTFPHLCGHPMSLAAVLCLLLPLRAFMASAPFAAHPALFDFSAPAYGHSAPFAAHPALFMTFPHLFAAILHLLQPSRAHKSQLSTLPAVASSPGPSRRENGGLCPHPLKGPDP